MVGRRSRQRLVHLSLQVLGRAAYIAGTCSADTLEVRLALAVLWTILHDRLPLTAFWDRLLRADAKPWESAHAELYRVKHALRREGWDAPPVP